MESEDQSLDLDKVLSHVVSCVRASTSLAAQDVDFYRNLDSSVQAAVNESSDRLISMMNSVLSSIDSNAEPMVSDRDSIQSSWREFSNVLDNLLEKSDRSLDKIASGQAPRSVVDTMNDKKIQYMEDNVAGEMYGSGDPKRIEKPQLHFKKPIDNTESHPFKPLLQTKPNALVSLDKSLRLIPAENDEPMHYGHPYEHEIDTQPYNENVLEIRGPFDPMPWSETGAIWVDTADGVESMLRDLQRQTEIAIDLEHHDYRSYYGIVCLMQISTREQDYLVDTIALRDDLEILNLVFTDPLITKVLHGAFMDIIWLQRDLGLYIVSLFDTYHASKALGLPRNSLAYLLENYANFKTSKKYQLADWRIRPLSRPMQAYARADTHFLLNIYDQLRNKLVEKNLLSGVLKESRNVAKRRFEYSSFRPKKFSPVVYSPIEKENPWANMMYQYNIGSDREPLLKELYEWRDLTARRDDESPRYIMPNQLLVSLVAYTPVDPLGVVSVSHSMTDHVRKNSKVIANMIKKFMSGNRTNDSSILVKEPRASISNDVHNYSVEQLKSINSAFNTIKTHCNISNGIASNSMKLVTKSLLFDDFLSGNGKDIVSFDKKFDKFTTIEYESVKARSKHYVDILESLKDVAYDISAVAEEVLHEPALRKEKRATDIEVSHEKEDLDEIVVLKPRSKRDTSTRPVKQPDIEAAVDYSKVGQVMTEQARKEYRKRKRFDPYGAAEQGGPQPAKVKRNKTRGKAMSFKR